ncbi:substrate-binding domain-containing protein [Rubritalea tangerina]|uniref:Substrate-binding domain-containing protein n=1 Tax=Rubritalea tangerina TaxID=430798 RepID=A0ABW4ZEA0_9BACT
MPIIPQRQSLLGQTVTSIRIAITTGDWTGMLPSERRLCDQLKISRSTLRRALEKVEEEGLIEPGRPGRRRRITYSGETLHPDELKQASNQKVIWLTRLPLSELPSTSLRLIALLQNQLAGQRCIVDIIRVPERIIANPQQHMEDWLSEHDAEAYVLHWMPENVQLWFQQTQQPCCIIGSPGNGVNLPSVEIDSLASMRHALAMLQRQGHQTIGLIREESPLVGEINIERILLEQAPGHFQATVASCPKDPYLIDEALERMWKNPEKRPSAIICSLPHLALYAMSWFQKRGISIPDEVSILTLRWQPLLDYFTPSIAHYVINEERAIIEMTPRLLDLLRHQTCSTSPINLVPEFVDGETLLTNSTSAEKQPA